MKQADREFIEAQRRIYREKHPLPPKPPWTAKRVVATVVAVPVLVCVYGVLIVIALALMGVFLNGPL